MTCGACSVRGGGRGWSPSSLGANHNQHERGRGRVVGSWSACVSANGRARGGGPHVCVRTVCRAVLRSARRVSRRTLWTVSLKKPGGRRKLPSKRESSKRKHATRCGSCPSVHSPVRYISAATRRCASISTTDQRQTLGSHLQRQQRDTSFGSTGKHRRARRRPPRALRWPWRPTHTATARREAPPEALSTTSRTCSTTTWILVVGTAETAAAPLALDPPARSASSHGVSRSRHSQSLVEWTPDSQMERRQTQSNRLVVHRRRRRRHHRICLSPSRPRS